MGMSIKQKEFITNLRYWKGKKRPPFSEEWRRKMGESRSGENHWLKNGRHSDETKLKISESQKKRYINGYKNPRLGKKNSLKNRLAVSKACKGRKLSMETRKKMSEAHRGKKAYNWSKYSELCHLIRNSFKYRQWRCDVFERDDYTCVECGVRGVKLNAHHIKSFISIVKKHKIKSVEQSLICEELWNINNGLTLCEKCHKKTDNYLNPHIKNNGS